MMILLTTKYSRM